MVEDRATGSFELGPEERAAPDAEPAQPSGDLVRGLDLRTSRRQSLVGVAVITLVMLSMLAAVKVMAGWLAAGPIARG